MSSKFLEYINYFENLASLDPVVRHGKVENGEPRKGFIDVADPEEVDASILNKIDPPFVVQIGCNGGLTDSLGCINDMRFHVLRFYAKAEIDGANQPAIKAAYSQSDIVMQEWVNHFLLEYNTNSCSRWRNINVNSIRWEKLPVMSDYFCGWQLSFSEQRPKNSFLQKSNYW